MGHIHRRVTDHLNVVYYVADTFSAEYTGSSLKTVERNVEDDYIANLRNNCWKEKQQSEWPVGPRAREQEGDSPLPGAVWASPSWLRPVSPGISSRSSEALPEAPVSTEIGPDLGHH